MLIFHTKFPCAHSRRGVILLVDATQGVGHKTLSLTLGRKIAQPRYFHSGVVSKIDSPNARIADIKASSRYCTVDESTILSVSGKTRRCQALLDRVVELVPAPQHADATQGLIFDFGYSDHRGVIVYLRVFGGSFSKGDTLRFVAAGEDFIAVEVGTLSPKEFPTERLIEGEIGYIVTGVEKPRESRRWAIRDQRETSPAYWIHRSLLSHLGERVSRESGRLTDSTAIVG